VLILNTIKRCISAYCDGLEERRVVLSVNSDSYSYFVLLSLGIDDQGFFGEE